MKIVITPGERNEELIEEVKRVKATATPEEWEDYLVKNVALNEELMDALYYANEPDSKHALEDQAQYFHDLLTDYEREYFVFRLENIEKDF